ncbi:MAG TPA: hypothetical protein VF755_08395 [Catenuloplanes sp.]|jgi:hypothetical protein
MGDHQPKRARRTSRALLIGLLAAGMCVGLGGAAAPTRQLSQAVTRIAGLSDLAPTPAGRSWAPRPVVRNGLRTVATSAASTFAVHTESGPKTFLPGINLGSTTPGHQPGELAMDARDYRTWFTAMMQLGIRAIRVYTIHPPAFYEELAAHNRVHPDRPVYLVQGVHLPDESYVTKRNLYDPGVTAGFTAELRAASAAVAGRFARPVTPGRASGAWRTDVSDWLAGWVIGVEWDPNAIAASDRRNAGAPAATGRYVRSTAAASPTERWLADRMDELAGAEARRGRSAPMAFVNWASTDPLRHPDEPLAQEDLVGVDANRMRATDAWPGGLFASYHAYPYYPDFQRHQPDLQAFRFNGRSDPYAGYLASLRRHHGELPVLVTEFGVPSSLGSAHHGPLGRDQGNHSEQNAMRTDAELLRMIHDTGMGGGFVFSWSDEWFKLTWNTVAHQAPADRRQLWHDPLTNEQHFGMIATDALGSPDAVPVTLLDNPAGRPARRITGRVDEAYLHLRVELADPVPTTVTVGLDVLADLSGPTAPGSGDAGVDVALSFDLPVRGGQAWLRAELDPMPLDYPVAASARPPARNGWQRFQLITNRDLVVPSTGRRLPAELLDTGNLRYGRWDPADPTADSRALWRLDRNDLVVRLPWAMAGFADPSSHRVLVPRPVDRPADGVVAVAQPATRASPGVTVVVSTGGLDQRGTPLRWDGWQRVYYRERLKQGASHLRDAFVSLAP